MAERKGRAGRSLGATRGRGSQKLQDLAAHDRRLLDPQATPRRDDSRLEQHQADTTENAPIVDQVETSTPQVSDNPLEQDAAQAAASAETEPDIGETRVELDDRDAGSSVLGVPDANISERNRPRADFRDSLQLLHWSTTQELWARYVETSVKLRKQTGVKVKPTQLIRAVVEVNMPDSQSKSGASKLADYADRWSEKLERTRQERKPQNISLRRRTVEGLEQAQLTLLEDRGTKVAIARMISGIADEHFPSLSDAKSLLGIS